MVEEDASVIDVKAFDTYWRAGTKPSAIFAQTAAWTPIRYIPLNPELTAAFDPAALLPGIPVYYDPEPMAYNQNLSVERAPGKSRIRQEKPKKGKKLFVPSSVDIRALFGDQTPHQILGVRQDISPAVLQYPIYRKFQELTPPAGPNDPSYAGYQQELIKLVVASGLIAKYPEIAAQYAEHDFSTFSQDDLSQTIYSGIDALRDRIADMQRDGAISQASANGFLNPSATLQYKIKSNDFSALGRLNELHMIVRELSIEEMKNKKTRLVLRNILGAPPYEVLGIDRNASAEEMNAALFDKVATLPEDGKARREMLRLVISRAMINNPAMADGFAEYDFQSLTNAQVAALLAEGVKALGDQVSKLHNQTKIPESNYQNYFEAESKLLRFLDFNEPDLDIKELAELHATLAGLTDLHNPYEAQLDIRDLLGNQDPHEILGVATDNMSSKVENAALFEALEKTTSAPADLNAFGAEMLRLLIARGLLANPALMKKYKGNDVFAMHEVNGLVTDGIDAARRHVLTFDLADADIPEFLTAMNALHTRVQTDGPTIQMAELLEFRMGLEEAREAFDRKPESEPEPEPEPEDETPDDDAEKDDLGGGIALGRHVDVLPERSYLSSNAFGLNKVALESCRFDTVNAFFDGTGNVGDIEIGLHIKDQPAIEILQFMTTLALDSDFVQVRRAKLWRRDEEGNLFNAIGDVKLEGAIVDNIRNALRAADKVLNASPKGSTPNVMTMDHGGGKPDTGPILVKRIIVDRYLGELNVRFNAENGRGEAGSFDLNRYGYNGNMLEAPQANVVLNGDHDNPRMVSIALQGPIADELKIITNEMGQKAPSSEEKPWLKLAIVGGSALAVVAAVWLVVIPVVSYIAHSMGGNARTEMQNKNREDRNGRSSSGHFNRHQQTITNPVVRPYQETHLPSEIFAQTRYMNLVTQDDIKVVPSATVPGGVDAIIKMGAYTDDIAYVRLIDVGIGDKDPNGTALAVVGPRAVIHTNDGRDLTTGLCIPAEQGAMIIAKPRFGATGDVDAAVELFNNVRCGSTQNGPRR